MTTMSLGEFENLFERLVTRYKLNEQAKLWALAMLQNALDPVRHPNKPGMSPGRYNIAESRMLFRDRPTISLHEFVSRMGDLCEQIPLEHFRGATITMEDSELKIAYEVPE